MNFWRKNGSRHGLLDSWLQFVASLWPAIVPSFLVIVLAALSALGSDILQREAVGMLINLVVVVGLYIFAGNTGILSFGHTSFMAVGAYLTALVTIPPAFKGVLLPHLVGLLQHIAVGPIEAAAIAALGSALFAAVLAGPLMRLSGLAASLAMFLVLLVVYVVLQNWADVTRGYQTLVGVPTTVTLQSASFVAVVVILIAAAFQQSRIGLRLRASREDEPAAAAIAINIVAYRRIAFVLSASVVGVGGFEYAQFYSAFNPDSFYLGQSFVVIAMLVVGGVMSLMGAVLGTVTVSALTEVLRLVEQGGLAIGPLIVTSPPGLQQIGIGIAMLAILLLRPEGLAGSREVSWQATASNLERVTRVISTLGSVSRRRV